MRELDPLAQLPHKDFAPRVLKVAISDPRWFERAACRGVGASPQGIKIFFPGPGRYGTKAANYCNSCPVQNECRQTAVNDEEEWGIWGGEIREQK